MTPIQTCPSSLSLRDFLAGDVSDEEAVGIERHLAECSRCSALMPELNAPKSLETAMRAASELKWPDADHAVVANLISRIESLSASRQDTNAERLQDTDANDVESNADVDLRFLAPAQSSDELGRLGTHRVLHVLGVGGMGIVFEAEDTLLQRRVALKVLRPEMAAHPTARERFLREARAMASIEHPNIVSIHQVGDERDIPFLAMPLLRGETLQAWMTRFGRTPAPPEFVVAVGRGIAAGLAVAHRRGLIHRDIKPANVWLEEAEGQGLRGEGEGKDTPVQPLPLSPRPLARIKILDFGLARPLASQQMTQAGMIVGTAAYMAPEQARGGAVDARTDLFALGCVLYRLCTGELPFSGSDAVSTLLAIATEQPVPLRERNPAVSAELAKIVMQLLAKRPEDRPASAGDVLQALAECSSEKTGTASLTQSRKDAKEGKRSLFFASLRLGVKPVFLGLLVALGVIVIVTDRGKVQIETLDEDVQVHVEQNGKQVQVLDKKNNFEFRLRSGTYSLRLVSDKEHVRLEQDTVTIVRGQTAVARIVGATQQPESSLEDWLAATKPLQGMPQLDAVVSKLKELNPDWDGVPKSFVKLPGFAFWDDDPTHPVSAIRFHSNDIVDLSPLRALSDLTNLSIAGIPKDGFSDRESVTPGRLRDLAPLQDLSRLTTFHVSFQPVRDLSALRGKQQLHSVSLDRTLVDDLSPLAELPKLTVLEIINAPVRDIRPLTGLKSLTNLELISTPLTDLKPLVGLKLTNLICSHSPIQDLGPLAGMPLERLECNYCQINDLTPLRGMPLKQLRCENNEGLTDLTPLRDLPLKELWCDIKNQSSLDALKAHPTLETINGQPAAKFLEAAAGLLGK